MDFNSPIYIDTASGTTSPLNINNIASSDVSSSLGYARSGYKVMTAVFGNSDASGYIDKRAVDDGLDFGDAYLGGRQVAFVVGVFGSTLEDYHSKVQSLTDLMRLSPRYFDSSYGFRTIYFSQPTIDTTTYSTGLAALQIFVRPSGLPQVTFNGTHSIEQSLGTTSRGFSGTVQLTFIAQEPYKFRQTQRSISISVASVESSTTTTSLPNIGPVPLAPIVEIIGSTASTAAAMSISSITFEIDSRTVKLNNIDFSAKDANNETRWYLDFDAHAIYRGVRSTSTGGYVQTLRMDVIDTTYYGFGTIIPSSDGTTSMYLTYTGGNKPATVTCQYREAYY